MTYTKELKRTRASFDAANQLKTLAASNEEVSVRQTVAPSGTRHAMASHTDPAMRNSLPPYSSHHQLEDDQAESLVAAALREDRRNISDAWDMMLFNDAYLDDALTLVKLEPDPRLIGAATLLAVLRSSLSGPHVEAARALAKRLVEQHADAIFAKGLGTVVDGTPRFVELVQSDVQHNTWHEVAKDESFVELVGAIAGGLGRAVVDVKDSHGRKA